MLSTSFGLAEIYLAKVFLLMLFVVGLLEH